MSSKRLPYYIDASRSIINLDWFAITIHLSAGFEFLNISGFDFFEHERPAPEFKQRHTMRVDGKSIAVILSKPTNTICYKTDNVIVVKFNNLILYDRSIKSMVDAFLDKLDYERYYVSELHLCIDNCKEMYHLSNMLILPKMRQTQLLKELREFAKSGIGKTKKSTKKNIEAIIKKLKDSVDSKVEYSYMPKTSDGKGRKVSFKILTLDEMFENVIVGSLKTGLEASLYNKYTELRESGKLHIISCFNKNQIPINHSIYRYEIRMKHSFLKRYKMLDNSTDILFQNNYENFFKDIFNTRLKPHTKHYDIRFGNVPTYQKLDLLINETSLRTIKMFLRYEIIKLDETGDSVYLDGIRQLFDELSKYYDKPQYFIDKIVERLIKEKIINHDFTLKLQENQ